MADLPFGTVTFLFTDIEGSTRRWEHEPRAMADALALHNSIVRNEVESRAGAVVSTMGDGFAVVFASAANALAGALEAQRSLAAATWPEETGALRVRMGLHTGEGVLRDGQYLNQPLNRCAPDGCRARRPGRDVREHGGAGARRSACRSHPPRPR